jgi:hypothetical protein
VWLALAAVLLRAFVPDGFMPQRHAGGWALDVCPASPLAKLHGGHGMPGIAHHADCPFAAAAAPALPGGAFAFLSLLIPAVFYAPPALRPAPPSLWTLPHARGPPAIPR